MKTEKALLDTLLDSLADTTVIATDRSGIITQFNRGASRMLGYDENDVRGKLPLSRLFPPLFLEKIFQLTGSGDEDIFSGLCRNWNEVRDTDWLLLRNDGSALTVDLTLSPVLSDQGSYEGTLLVARDNRILNRIQDQLADARHENEEISRTKSSFLANMSHEIRTPLNGIIGLTDLLIQSEMSEEQHEKLVIIQKSADTLLNLTNDILDYTRLEAGKFKLGLTPFSLKTLITEIKDILEVSIRKREISFGIDIGENVSDNLIGDRRRIKQILINLLGNAMKFTMEGSICIEIQNITDTETDTTLLFRVKDTGIGISSEEKSKLFQYFSQVDTSETRKYSGSGLGLAISRELVSLMDGEIGVESEPGKGSVFWFTVKLGKNHEEPINHESSVTVDNSDEQGIPEKNSIRVLIAEDNKINQLVAMNFMKKLGYQADLVENGLEAVEACKKVFYDLILMDQMMPVMDGIEATAQIRGLGEEAKNPDIRIIALTANAMKGDREILLEAGMDDYIPKPVILKDVKEILERNLAK